MNSLGMAAQIQLATYNLTRKSLQNDFLDTLNADARTCREGAWCIVTRAEAHVLTHSSAALISLGNSSRFGHESAVMRLAVSGSASSAKSFTTTMFSTAGAVAHPWIAVMGASSPTGTNIRRDFLRRETAASWVASREYGRSSVTGPFL